MSLTEYVEFNLLRDQVEWTSPKDKRYNSLAWAIGGDDEKKRWWAPDPFDSYHWPSGIQKKETVESYIEIFEQHGYECCGTDASFEPEFVKVAIYCNSTTRTLHVARQLETGRWTSKLGQAEDIIHDTLGCLKGAERYGTVHAILRCERS